MQHIMTLRQASFASPPFKKKIIVYAMFLSVAVGIYK